MAIGTWMAILCGLHGSLAFCDVTLSGIPLRAPFQMKASVDRSRLIIDVAFQDGWHAYARDVGGGAPIRIETTDGEKSSQLGQLRLPATEGGELGGHVRLIQWLKLPVDEAEFDLTLHMTVCDALECLPPYEIRLSGSVTPLAVLLVAAQNDDRTDKIATFLRDRHFRVDTITYGEVTAEACDTHDLVIADSTLFTESRRVDVADFPKTTSPLITVGFLGTELVEAHGLAMTSGYI